MEKELSPCRVWLYARIPGDYVGTMDSIKVCALQAHADGCTVVGSSTDEHGGWLLRPGYREMLRHIRKGEIDTVYICRMRHISRSEGHLISFFRQLMANTCPQTKEQKMQRQKARSEIANAKPKGKRQVKASQGNTSYGKMVKQDKPFVKKQNTHTEQKPTAK